MKKRHPITLLEIMIVILLIGLVGGVLSYNLRGALERGKEFRTKEGKERLKAILELEISKKPNIIDELTGPESKKYVRKYVIKSGLIPENQIEKFIVDGWGEDYVMSKTEKGELKIESHHLPDK